jgi:hypothetical protein
MSLEKMGFMSALEEMGFMSNAISDLQAKKVLVCVCVWGGGDM